MPELYNVCGIDPGVANIGFAVITPGFSIVDTKQSKVINDNLSEFYISLVNYFTKYRVTHLALEKPFCTGFTANKLYAVTEVIGIIRLTCQQLDIDIKLYSPKNAKKIFTNSGNSDKKTIMQQVEKRYSYSTKSTHIADAIMLASCLVEELTT